MTVGRDYLLKKPLGPSAPKLFLDTRIVPLAVNAAGSLEVVLDRASLRTGVRPAVILAGVTGLLSLLLARLLRADARHPSQTRAKSALYHHREIDELADRW